MLSAVTRNFRRNWTERRQNYESQIDSKNRHHGNDSDFTNIISDIVGCVAGL